MSESAVAADDGRAEVESLYTELDAVTADIAIERGKLDELYERRRAVFAQLLAHNERQAVVARRAGVSPMAVAFAVGKPQGKNGKASKQAKRK